MIVVFDGGVFVQQEVSEPSRQRLHPVEGVREELSEFGESWAELPVCPGCAAIVARGRAWRPGSASSSQLIALTLARSEPPPLLLLLLQLGQDVEEQVDREGRRKEQDSQQSVPSAPHGLCLSR